MGKDKEVKATKPAPKIKAHKEEDDAMEIDEKKPLKAGTKKRKRDDEEDDSPTTTPNAKDKGKDKIKEKADKETEPAKKKARSDAPVAPPAASTSATSSSTPVEVRVEGDENVPVANFRVSKGTQDILAQTGITSLFPIQARAFDFVYDGKDVIGRARTGTGKTLSFCLPIIEKLLLAKFEKTRGRGPRLLILAPTRELANQVAKVAAQLGEPQGLATLCIYGGVPYDRQEMALSRGLDIVVGTPGRVLDHLERGNLSLLNLVYLVLDEADEMLNMGFREDIEKVFATVPAENLVQKLLYSATIPHWVTTIARQYLRPGYIIVDLVSESKNPTNQGAAKVKHLAMRTTWQGRLGALADVVKIYGTPGGKTMFFCNTKSEANEVALSSTISSDCQVLHGDIAQQQRDITLASFREARFHILVCTDVAARGLDIEGVDLVIQSAPPKDWEQYVHRSGRTGRAGRSGTSITFFTHNEAGKLSFVERQTGIKIKRVGMPQPEDIYKHSGKTALKQLTAVSEEMLAHFKSVAEEATSHHEGDSLSALAAALALVAGFGRPIQGRSLLSGVEGYRTVMVEGPQPINSRGYAVSALSRDAGEQEDGKGLNLKDCRITLDGKALIDCPTDVALEVVKYTLGNPKARFKYSIPTELPDLADDNASQGSGGRGGFGGRGGGGGRDNGGGGRFGGGGFGGGRGGGGGYSGGGGRGGGGGGGFGGGGRGGGGGGGRGSFGRGRGGFRGGSY